MGEWKKIYLVAILFYTSFIGISPAERRMPTCDSMGGGRNDGDDQIFMVIVHILPLVPCDADSRVSRLMVLFSLPQTPFPYSTQLPVKVICLERSFLGKHMDKPLTEYRNSRNE